MAFVPVCCWWWCYSYSYTSILEEVKCTRVYQNTRRVKWYVACLCLYYIKFDATIVD